MSALGRGQASNGSDPVLDVFIVTNNGASDPAATNTTLEDPTELSWVVYDVSTPEKFAAPVEVASGTVTDFEATYPEPGAARLARGCYFAQWTPPSDEPLGLHRITWSWTVPTYRGSQDLVDGSWSEEFEVVAFRVAPLSQGYCLIRDIREEGVTTNDADDARVQRIIGLQSRYIERVTGRFFEARRGVKRFSGNGSRGLLFVEPVVAVDEIAITATPFYPTGLSVGLDSVRVFNRHLSQRLTQPDDRNDPKLELFCGSEDLPGTRPLAFAGLVWPRGQQNVTVSGAWGYTDWDGSPVGCTPDLIRHALKLLVMRELPRMCTDRDKREDAQKRHRLLSEGTRDQRYQLEGNQLRGAFTGDSEIDTILASFMRPPILGAA